jgi:hypothetical protein
VQEAPKTRLCCQNAVLNLMGGVVSSASVLAITRPGCLNRFSPSGCAERIRRAAPGRPSPVAHFGAPMLRCAAALAAART